MVSKEVIGLRKAAVREKKRKNLKPDCEDKEAKKLGRILDYRYKVELEEYE